MNATQSLEDAARELAAMHAREHPVDDLWVYWCDDRSGRTIRLVEVSSWYLPVHEGVVDTYRFGKTAEVLLPTEVALLAPEEWEAVQQGRLRLPKGWPPHPVRVWPTGAN
jgi:hypothetical protein